MKIAIMQPYFFPYIGQFQLIHAADRFVLCDDVQYIRHGWINRNRVLKPNEGHYYISIPLAKHSSKEVIKNIYAIEGEEWKIKILRQVEHYKKTAPYYMQVCNLLQSCFASGERNVCRMNGNYLKAVCDYLGIPFKLEISSEMNFDYTQIQTTDDWAIQMSKQLNATAYLNPPGGVNLYDKKKFENNGIDLVFIKPHLKEYNQFRKQFEPGLSIIDVMMFNSPEEIRSMLNEYEEL